MTSQSGGRKEGIVANERKHTNRSVHAVINPSYGRLKSARPYGGRPRAQHLYPQCYIVPTLWNAAQFPAKHYASQACGRSSCYIAYYSPAAIQAVSRKSQNIACAGHGSKRTHPTDRPRVIHIIPETDCLRALHPYVSFSEA